MTIDVTITKGSTIDVTITNGSSISTSITTGSLISASITSGVPGVGLPSGGLTGQVAQKVDGTDYNIIWADSGAAGTLNSLTDTTITTPVNGEVLKYNGSVWINDVDSVLNVINDLSDVVITTVADNDILAYSTGTNKWINQSLSEAGLASASQGSLADSALQNVVEDLTPQLGAALDVNSNSIVSISAGNISITPDTTGKVIIDGLSHPTADGINGQVMTTDGVGNLTLQDAGGISNVVEDLTPQLGGDLDVNNNSIVSVANGDIPIIPNGTGDVAITLSTGGLFTMTSPDAKFIKITSTDAGTSNGPEIELFRDSPSPAANDFLGAISLFGETSTSVKVRYARFRAYIVDPTNASEDGGFEIATRLNASTAARINIESGMTIGGATDQGVGTLNVSSDLYISDTSVTTSLAGKLVNVVEDLTPQLGGNLDCNSFDVHLQIGSSLVPSLTFGLDTDTGIYRAANGILGFTSNGTRSATLSSVGFFPDFPIKARNGAVSTPSFTFDSDSDSGMYREASNILGFSTGGVKSFQVNTDGSLEYNSALNAETLITGDDDIPNKKFCDDTYATLGQGIDSTAAAASSLIELVVTKTAITDNVATAMITVTIPNAAHSAVMEMLWNNRVSDDESARVGKIYLVINRVAGVDTIKTLTTIDETIATAGTETLTQSVTLSGNTGAVSATQTFDIEITLDTSASTTANSTVYAQLLNGNATGITIAAA